MECAGIATYPAGTPAKKLLTRRLEFQEAAREHWANMAALEDVPDELDDFGYYYPREYVETTCGIALLSKFSVMPRAGGLDNQDWFWVQDLFTYLRGYARAQYDATPVREHDDESSDNPPVVAKWKPFG